MVKTLQSELSARDEWIQKHIAGDVLPFSFYYGKRAAKDLLPAWKREFSQSTDADAAADSGSATDSGNAANSAGITRYETRWTDPETGLVATCRAASYPGCPAVEWTLYLKNTGADDTPILENIQGAEIIFDRSAEEKLTLRTTRGDTVSYAAFEPVTIDLEAVRRTRFAPAGGKPCGVGGFPYFNLQIGDRGVITAIGWPGQWAAYFNIGFHPASPVVIAAGQELTCLSLRPGEEIRSPLVLLMFYEGDYMRSQNIWRRFMLDYNTPKFGGKPVEPFTQRSTDLFPSEESELKGIRECAELAKSGLHVDQWHIDAGWFPLPPGGDWWEGAGTWVADKARFPNGLKPVADAARANGMNMTLWFEPERVYKDTWLYNNHPEWLIMNDFPMWQHCGNNPSDNLLNLGNPEALGWLISHIDGQIAEIGFNQMKLDFCTEPLTFWRGADGPCRQGMTENLYVQGYLKFLDELRRRHPDFIIDSCAGGAQRYDIETARRAIMIAKTDYWMTTPYDDGNCWEGHQCITYGLLQWFPDIGSGGVSTDDYDFLTFFATITVGLGGIASEYEKEKFRDRLKIWREVILENMRGADYYPLTEYSQKIDVWVAYQFNRPAASEGIVIALRRDKSDTASMAFKLSDLDTGADSGAEYEVSDVLKKTMSVIKGQELVDDGLVVNLPEPRSAVLIHYKRR